MPTYSFKGKDRAGRPVDGSLAASTKGAAESVLRARGIRLDSIRRSYFALGNFEPRVKTGDVVLFTRQLSSLMDAGIGITAALTTLYQQLEHARLKQVVQDLRIQLEQGRALPDALSRHPKVFPPIYVAMIVAGTQQGQYVKALNEVADYLDRGEDLKKRVRAMMIYPIMVITGIILTMGFILYFVMPNFEELFDDGMELPLVTELMFQASGIMREAPWLILLVLAAFAGLLVFLSRTTIFKMVLDRYGLRIPVFGPIIQKAALARFARTMSSSLHAGVNILDAFSLCADTSGNTLISASVREARRRVEEGTSVAPALRQSGYFPPISLSMIEVGQTSGRLDDMMERVANEFEKDVERSIEAAMELLKPAIVVLLGIMVGGVLIAIYLPLWEAISNAGGDMF